MKNFSEIAVSKFLDGYNCAQSVFYSFCEILKLDKNTALKLSSGFGGGMGHKGEVCGAVTGGIMVIGSKFGRGEKDDQSFSEITYQKTTELMDKFTGQHGTCLCRQLLNGCDLATEEGRKQFKENDLKNKICLGCVKSVVEIVENLLNES
jgi:C_GCAxxG_C_C family probable redox protein